MSYRDWEVRQGPGIDLKGGQWQPEYNDIISAILGIHYMVHKFVEIIERISKYLPKEIAQELTPEVDDDSRANHSSDRGSDP